MTHPVPFRTRWPLALAALVACVLVAPLSAQKAEPEKALSLWTKMYGSGKLDLSKPRIQSSSPGVKFGCVPKERAQAIGHLEELETICRRMEKTDNAEVAELLIELVGVSLGGGRIDTPEAMPASVAKVGDDAIDRLGSTEALAFIESVARDDKADELERAAAVRALGRRDDKKYETLIEAALGAEDGLVRLAGADACSNGKNRFAAPALIKALGSEQEDAVAAMILIAMRAIVEQHKEAVDEDVLRRIADSAIGVLGRCTWRTDVEACELLMRVRSAQSVPALIEVLERWQEKKLDEEKVSGTLRHAAHDALKSLTGAVFAMEQPEKWREWWGTVKNEFVVADVPEKVEGKGGPNETVTENDFFGIPVRGSRVLFVVDSSGSMAAPIHGRNPSSDAANYSNKMDAAKGELKRVVARLTIDQQFNCVRFSNSSELWKKGLVEASERNKKTFDKWADDLRADGGTNLWSAMHDGLAWESLVYGSRYGATVDEVFILSDGLPSLGEVQDPKQILRLVAETNRYSRLKINTVYISGPPEDERRFAEIVGMSGADFMRQLAEQNGGTAISF